MAAWTFLLLSDLSTSQLVYGYYDKQTGALKGLAYPKREQQSTSCFAHCSSHATQLVFSSTRLVLHCTTVQSGGRIAGRKRQTHCSCFQFKSQKKKGKIWRCGGSNPVPLACKASALPFELHPLFRSSPLKNILEQKNNIPLTRGIRNVDTNQIKRNMISTKTKPKGI